MYVGRRQLLATTNIHLSGDCHRGTERILFSLPIRRVVINIARRVCVCVCVCVVHLFI